MSVEVLIISNHCQDKLSVDLEEWLMRGWEIKGYSTCVKLSGDIQYSSIITRLEVDYE